MKLNLEKQAVPDNLISPTRLRARLHEINAWVNKLKEIQKDSQASPEQKAAAISLARYFWVLRILTKGALFYKLRTSAIKKAEEESSRLLLRFANASGDELKDIQKKQARLVFYQIDCDLKRSINIATRWNATEKLPEDLEYMDQALDLIGMDPTDDLRPQSFLFSKCVNQNIRTIFIQKKKGGRPKQSDTLEFFKWVKSGAEQSIENVCKYFDQIELPVSRRFINKMKSKDGVTWTIAYRRHPEQMAKWFNDKQVAYKKAHSNAHKSDEE